ncbi:MAG: Ig-like domain-containing protein [Myxococcota bacterium]|nr:Ig-like domain-containing protein [Myxococcota bacterium]
MAAAQKASTITLGASADAQLVPPGPIKADGTRIQLTVVVVDSTGSLASEARFRGSSAKIGRLDSNCSSDQPGIYQCWYTTPERSDAKESLRLKVKLPSGEQLDSTFALQITSSGKASIRASASPAELTLIDDSDSNLTFKVTDSRGNGVADLDLRARANTGTIEGLQSSVQGSWSARYVPTVDPSRGFAPPQVAVISVWDADHPQSTARFQVIPLIGKVTFPVDTQRPGASLTLKVGDKTFPTVTAGADGKAFVPITVPPGIETASAELVETNGRRSTQVVPLRVPPFNRIGLGGLPDFVPADGKHQTTVRMMVVDGKGRPAASEEVSIEASTGTVTAARFVGDGIYEAVYTAPSLQASGDATLTASVAGEAKVSQVTGTIRLEVPGPGSLSLSADPVQLSSSTKKSKITATLLDQSEIPAGKLYSVELRTADGPLRKVSSSSSKGTFSADLAVDWKKKTRVQALAKVRGNKQAATQLIVLPMSDAVMTNQKLPVTVLSLDRYSNPVSGIAVNCKASGGGSVTSSGQTDAHGMAALLYTASALAGYATVRCETGGVSYTAPLWQTNEPMDDFSFPVSGGQQRSASLTTWSKLRASVVLQQAQAVAAAPVVTSSGTSAWGEETATTTDSGSIAPPGEVAEIQISSVPTSVPVNGGTVNLLVRVTDAQGTLVPGSNIIIITDVGTVSAKTDNGNGTFSAVLTVPPRSEKDRVNITVTRPSGHPTAFGVVSIGGSAVASAKPPAKAKGSKKAVVQGPAADSGERMARRRARIWAGWAPGSYSYNSTPCLDAEGPCEAPDDAVLDDYDFLKAEVRAPTVGSFSFGGEWFPFQDYVGMEAGYSRLAYSTDFESSASANSNHCASHFCDSMNYVHVGAQARFALLKKKGPLDVLLRVGPQFQDVVVFWRRENDAGEREPRFETIGLTGLRMGGGLRYTVTPKIQPHFDYNITLGLTASLGDDTFSVPGVTNHNVNAGVSFFPWKGLVIDASYDMISRSLGLSYEEGGLVERGSLSDTVHGIRINAGWAF